jgi:hypothetical protein
VWSSVFVKRPEMIGVCEYAGGESGFQIAKGAKWFPELRAPIVTPETYMAVRRREVDAPQ